jgi:trehalose/maltose hydrolase-like predicted phosphorylase
VFGFGGVLNNEGKFELNPVLPEEWNRLKFAVIWKNKKIWIEITIDMINLTSKDMNVINIKIYGNSYIFKDRLSVPYKGKKK